MTQASQELLDRAVDARRFTANAIARINGQLNRGNGDDPGSAERGHSR
jgi:hypothetical protein